MKVTRCTTRPNDDAVQRQQVLEVLVGDRVDQVDVRKPHCAMIHLVGGVGELVPSRRK